MGAGEVEGTPGSGADLGDDAEGSAEVDPGGRRLEVLLVAIGRGLLIGLVAGAAGGTITVPIIGTAFGAAIGVAVAAGPTAIGAVALWLAARPGTSPEAFQRRSSVILSAIGVLVMAGVYAYVRWGVDTEAFAGGVAVGGAIAILLLVRAHGRISAIAPDPADAEPYAAERAIVAMIVVAAVGLGGWAGWTRFVAPEARAKRALQAERDQLARSMGLDDLYAYDLEGGARQIWCRPTEVGAGTGLERETVGYLSFGSGSLQYGDVDDTRRAVRLGRDALEDDGYTIHEQETDQTWWVYGVRSDQSALILGPGRTQSSDDDGVTIRLAEGCIDRQPNLEIEGEPTRRMLGAGQTDPARTEASCPDGEPARVVTVISSSHLRLAEAQGVWTLTDGAGGRVQPCDISDGMDGAVALSVPAAGPPIVRAAFGQATDGEQATLAVDVAAPDAAAEPLAAAPVLLQEDGYTRIDDGCPIRTVQTLRVRWNRPLGAEDVQIDPTAELREAYRVTIERAGSEASATPSAIVVPSGHRSERLDRLDHVLCLAEPGRPVRVAVAASDRLDLGGPPTARFDLAVAR